MRKLFPFLMFVFLAAACAVPSARQTGPAPLTDAIQQQAVKPAAAPRKTPAASPATARKPQPPVLKNPSVLDEPDTRYKAMPLPQEMRGVWIASVENMDWPSKPGLPPAAQQKEFTDLLDLLKQLNFNTVIVQVRPAADTFWPSRQEPWSYYLTGRQGVSPHYDPLAFMIKEAHKRGLAFHAWFNPFRVQNVSKAALSENHPIKKHPDWLVSYGGRKYYNPAIAAARRHSINVIAEVAEKYDVDGIHLDDYFYPYPVKKNGKTVPWPDAELYKKYGNGQPLAAWRRSNVNTFVRDLHQRLKATKPELPLGISPFGVWRNQSKDPTGSPTRAFSAYDDGLYADSRLWIEQGWIDYVVPQLYWHFGHRVAPYGVLLKWWNKEMERNPQVKLYIGLGTYKHGDEWKDPAELDKQMAELKKYKNVAGAVHFSAIRIKNNQGQVQKTLKKHYK